MQPDKDNTDHGTVSCPACHKTLPIQWERGNPKWWTRAIHLAIEAHKQSSPDCSGADSLTITPCLDEK